MVDGGAGRKASLLAVLVRFIGHHRNALDAFVAHLLGDLRHGELPVHGLAAGHGHCIVEQDLVSDIDARRHGGSDGQEPGVVVGAVA